MSNKRSYYIEINGIKESVDAVDSLLKKLDNLEERINALNQKGIKVEGSGGSSGGGSKSRVSDLTAEQKIIDQINRSQEKREVLEGEIGKKLAEEKQAMKELNAEQKSLAAMDRIEKSGILNGGDLPKTMLGMKSELADIKAAMQTMEVGSDEFVKATQRANELNEALKKIEETYGQYGRNVGNYANSIMEAMNGITIKVGEQEVKFNSTKEALRTFRENIKQMTVEGKQNTEEYDNQIKALHELEMALQEADSAINDVKTSSQGMDAALDWMQSFGAMGQITQGFSTFFGNTGFEESIQKLMSVQSVLQGIEQLRKQMNTGEGFGGMFAKASKSIDTFIAKLTGAKIGMNGLEMSTKAATNAVKGLSFAIKAIGTAGVMIALDWLIEKLQDVAKWFGSAKNSAVDSVDGMSLFAKDVADANKELEKQILLLQLKEAKGEISKEESRRQQIELTNKALAEQYQQLKLIMELNDSDDAYKNISEGMNSGDMFNPDKLQKTLSLWEDMKTAVLTNQDVYAVLEEKAEGGMEKFTKWAASVMTSAETTKEGFVAMSQNMAGQLASTMNFVIQNYQKMADGGKGAITQLINAMNDGGLINNFLTQLPALLGEKSEQIMSVFGPMIAQIRNIGVSMGIPGAKSTDDAIEEYKKGLKKIQDASTKAAKTTQKSTIDIEKETQQMRIQMMSEGILKTIAQLNKEREEKVKRLKQNKQLEAEINRYYDKKIAEERKKWQNKMLEEERQIWARVFSYNRETMEIESNAFMDEFERTIEKIKNSSSVSLYDIFLTETTGSKSDELAETFKNMRQLVFEREGLMSQNLWSDTNEEEYQKLYNEMKKIYDLSKQFEGLDFDTFLKFYDTNFYGDSLDTFVSNTEKIEKKWEDILSKTYYSFEDYYKQREDLLNKEISAEKEANNEWQKEELEKAKNHSNELIDNLDKKDKDYNKKRLKILSDFIEESQRIEKEHTDRDTALTVKHSNEQQKLDEERKKKEIDLYNDMYSEILDEYSNFRRQIDNIAEQQPKRNAWGFINVKETNRINNIVLEDLKKLREKLIQTQDSIKNLYEQKLIDEDTFSRLSNDIINQMDGVNQKIKETGDALSWKGKMQDFFQNLQQYYSAVSDSFQTIMGAMDDLNNYYFDLQQNALDKENELLQKKLDENEEILERHKNNVDKIESQLADARGDRRERLIDALNKEIIAQRRAQAEKEKLEKEQEKLEQKQKDLDYEREVAEYKSGLRQILFQTSQAVMQAATNNWPIPAIPLMALAAATGAAQYVMAQKQVPIKKADGGILEGPSHSEGGIPVGNTGIEVEGQEFIINKRQTAANRELIEAINNGNGKLTLEDIMNVGGITNVQPLDVNMPETSSLETAFVAYANRPIVVDVREITSRQESVRNVQVLSGIR